MRSGRSVWTIGFMGDFKFFTLSPLAPIFQDLCLWERIELTNSRKKCAFRSISAATYLPGSSCQVCYTSTRKRCISFFCVWVKFCSKMGHMQPDRFPSNSISSEIAFCLHRVFAKKAPTVFSPARMSKYSFVSVCVEHKLILHLSKFSTHKST